MGRIVIPSTSSANGLVPANFPNWRAALANVRNGTGFARLLCVGDSTTWGSLGGGNPPGPGGASYPSSLQARLNLYVAPAAVGLSIPEVDVPTLDTRWTVATGSGWSQNFFGFAGMCAWQCVQGATGALTFAPGINTDTVKIYYVTGPGFGTFNVSFDGGADNPINCNAASGIASTTVGPLALSAHTMTIHNVTVAGIAIVGFECWNSAAPSILVGNAGAPGTKLGAYVDSSGASNVLAVASLTAHAPNLVVLVTGTNDVAQSTSPSLFQSQLATFVALCKSINADLIVASLIQPQTGGGSPYQQASQQAANSGGNGFVDLYSRWSPVAKYVSLGYYADTYHPSARGYKDMAAAVYQAVAAVS